MIGWIISEEMLWVQIYLYIPILHDRCTGRQISHACYDFLFWLFDEVQTLWCFQKSFHWLLTFSRKKRFEVQIRKQFSELVWEAIRFWYRNSFFMWNFNLTEARHRFVDLTKVGSFGAPFLVCTFCQSFCFVTFKSFWEFESLKQVRWMFLD